MQSRRVLSIRETLCVFDSRNDVQTKFRLLRKDSH